MKKQFLLLLISVLAIAGCDEPIPTPPVSTVPGVDTTITPEPVESALRLNITLPTGEMSNYLTESAAIIAEKYSPKVVLELYLKGTNIRLYNHILALPSTTGVPTNTTLNVPLGIIPAGEYDILFWADYALKGGTTDHYYSTKSLKGVTLNPAIPYTASTDSRDAFSSFFNITVGTEPLIEKSLTVIRPMAKYRIVADDVALYKTLMGANKYPPLEELKISVSYDGFYPNTFNVSTGKPSNSANGIKYSSSLENIAEKTATLGSDYIFVGDTGSSVTVTIIIADKNNKEIAKISGNKIEYRSNTVTTITGSFLTAGVVNSGVSIDTAWGGVHDYELK